MDLYCTAAAQSIGLQSKSSQLGSSGTKGAASASCRRRARSRAAASSIDAGSGSLCAWAKSKSAGGVGRPHVQVQVVDLEPLDRHQRPHTVELDPLRPPDGVRDTRQVREQVGLGIGPHVNLLTRHDQRVSRRDRPRRQERDALLVAPHETARDLSGDDAAENRRHAPTVGRCLRPERGGRVLGTDVWCRGRDRAPADGKSVLSLRKPDPGPFAVVVLARQLGGHRVGPDSALKGCRWARAVWWA